MQQTNPRRRAARPLIVLIMVSQLMLGCDTTTETYSLEPIINGPLSDAATKGDTPQSGPVVVDTSSDPAVAPAAPIIQKGKGTLGGPSDMFDFSYIENAESGGTAVEGELTLNFVDVDIKEVVKAILGDRLQLNYTIDPKLAFRITLKTAQPIAEEDLLPTLEQVLGLNNVVLVERAGGYDVRTRDEVTSLPLLRSRQTPGFGMEILRLQYVAPSEIAKILGTYDTAAAIKVVDDARGLLIVAGTGPDRQKMTEIAALFDVDTMDGMSFGLFPIESASPTAIATELAAVFSPAEEGLSQGGVLRFLPIARLNSLLVIASDPENIDRVKLWLERLDKTAQKDEPQLYVHYLQNGEAKQVASVLGEIFGATNKSNADNPATGAVAPGYTPMTMTMNGVSKEGDSPSGPKLGTDSYGKSVATVSDIQKEPDATYSANATVIEVKDADGSNIRITADEANNSLFIFATPKKYRMIKAALSHLDTEPLQVLIEATIAEVTLNDELRYGVEWYFKNNNSSWSLLGSAGGVPSAIFPGFSYALALSDVNFVLNALDKVTNVNVISAPQIMVLDNRTAQLQVGDQVPVITQSAVSVTDPASPIVNSVEYWDTGVILSVTARVNSGGAVQLEVEQEVSDVVATTTSTIDSPTIQQRKMKSFVSVNDGATIALGGLIRDKKTKGKSGVPLLIDIPVVGNLFGTTSEGSQRTELLVLLTPHVIRDQADATKATEELKSMLGSLAPLGGKIRKPATP